MKRLLAAAFGLALNSCAVVDEFPVASLNVIDVTLPEVVSSTEPLRVIVEVEYGACDNEFHRLSQLSRTAQALTLSAVASRGAPNRPCPAVYSFPLTYEDPGTPARVGPFEVIINGKSWGKVNVQ